MRDNKTINFFKYIFLAMRPHQWLKSIFILLPVVFGQQLLSPNVLLKTLYIIIVFSLISSAMYLVNDTLDLEEDRQHPEKCKRPLASGRITVFQARVTALILISGMLPIAFYLKAEAAYVIVFYIALNYFYMTFLKYAVILDVFCIGAFFYIRILIGGLVGEVVLSNWIIICTLLLSLFLAFNKRRYDIEFSKDSRVVFSKYNRYFIDRMLSVVSSSIVITYTLYAMDSTTINRFETDHLVYTVPFVYYGIFRYLYLIDTKWFGGDPAKILVRDYKMLLNMALWFVVSISVIYFKL